MLNLGPQLTCSEMHILNWACLERCLPAHVLSCTCPSLLNPAVIFLQAELCSANHPVLPHPSFSGSLYTGCAPWLCIHQEESPLVNDITTGSPGFTERRALWSVTSPLAPLGVFWKLVSLDHTLHLETLSRQTRFVFHFNTRVIRFP